MEFFCYYVIILRPLLILYISLNNRPPESPPYVASGRQLQIPSFILRSTPPPPSPPPKGAVRRRLVIAVRFERKM